MENARIWKSCTEPRGAEICLRLESLILPCRKNGARVNAVYRRKDGCMRRPICVHGYGRGRGGGRRTKVVHPKGNGMTCDRVLIGPLNNASSFSSSMTW